MGLQLSCSSRTAADWFISDQQEVDMGTQFAVEIAKDSSNYPPYHGNPAVTSYIDSIGQVIVRHMGDRDSLNYHFQVLGDTNINAFAVPGGFVWMNIGLFAKARNEAEIAGVLAHELGHITMRHGAQMLVKQYGISFVLDLVVGDSTKLRSVMDIAAGLWFLKFSKDNEFQADSCAVEYLVKAGYHPDGMKTFLEYLAQMGGEPFFEPLSTHPPTEERVKRVAALIATKNVSGLRNPEKKSITP
jgi:predicted Zn-dependent protease